MILNGRNSNFVLKLPVGFIPKSVADRYSAYANSVHYPYLDVAHMVEATLQGVSIPGLSVETVQQTRQQSMQTYKGSKPVNAGFDKTLTLTFKLIDGYVNWSCLHEAIESHIQIFEPGQPLYWNDLRLCSLDRFGNIINVFTYNRIVLTALDGLNPSYANVSPDFQTFSMTFTYNIFDMEFKPVAPAQRKLFTIGDVITNHQPSIIPKPAPLVLPVIPIVIAKKLNDYTPTELVDNYSKINLVRALLVKSLGNNIHDKFVVPNLGENYFTVEPGFSIATMTMTINGVVQINPEVSIVNGKLFVNADMDLYPGDVLELNYPNIFLKNTSVNNASASLDVTKPINEYTPAEIVDNYSSIDSVKTLLVKSLSSSNIHGSFVVKQSGVNYFNVDPGFSLDTMLMTINGVKQLDPAVYVLDGQLVVGSSFDLYPGDVVELNYPNVPIQGATVQQSTQIAGIPTTVQDDTVNNNNILGTSYSAVVDTYVTNTTGGYIASDIVGDNDKVRNLLRSNSRSTNIHRSFVVSHTGDNYFTVDSSFTISNMYMMVNGIKQLYPNVSIIDSQLLISKDMNLYPNDIVELIYFP